MKISTSMRVATITLLALLFSISAAHTALKEAAPADGATVKAAPAHIDLVFNGPVRLIKLELMGVGHEMPTNFEANAEAMANYRLETPGMHPGAFTVNWAVIGADGHTVTNSYTFTVDPDAP
jgi:methionine-rich copper-binding protein CopC